MLVFLAGQLRFDLKHLEEHVSGTLRESAPKMALP